MEVGRDAGVKGAHELREQGDAVAAEVYAGASIRLVSTAVHAGCG
jgi:hypothetical protein